MTAHLVATDTSTTALVLAVALLVLAWRARVQGHRPRAVRFALLGVALLALGLTAGLVHPTR